MHCNRFSVTTCACCTAWAASPSGTLLPSWTETINCHAHLRILLPQNRRLPEPFAAPFPRQPEPRCNTLDFAGRVVVPKGCCLSPVGSVRCFKMRCILRSPLATRTPLETHQNRKAGCHLKADDTRLFIGYRICAQNSSKVLVLSNSRVRDVELNNSTILSKAGLKNFISASVMPIIRTKCTVFFFH